MIMIVMMIMIVKDLMVCMSIHMQRGATKSLTW